MSESEGHVFVNESGDVRVTVTDESSVVKALAVEVDAARVDKAFDRAYADLRKGARVKGFRAGKVPRSVLERMYGASMPEEIERILVTQTLPEAVELSNVAPIVEPGIEAERPASGEAFRYTARLEVKPEIELPELEGLPGKKPATEVSDDEVAEQLDQLRERSAPIVDEPEGTAAARGHFVRIDFEGKVDDEAFEGGSGKGMELELGSGRLIPGFEDQLEGAVAGEDRRVEVSFPDDYGAAELAGKDAVFEVHVEAVRKRELPSLDDEFAKDMGDQFESLDELRDHMRKELEEQRERAARSTLERSVMDALVERTDFEVPPGVVERQLQSQLQGMQRQYQGQVPPDVLQGELARMAEEGRPAAERRVREAWLLQAVVEERGFEVGDEDVDARLEEMAASQGMDAREMRKLAREQGWNDAIRAELLDRRALDLLCAEASVEIVSDGADAES